MESDGGQGPTGHSEMWTVKRDQMSSARLIKRSEWKNWSKMENTLTDTHADSKQAFVHFRPHSALKHQHSQTHPHTLSHISAKGHKQMDTHDSAMVAKTRTMRWTIWTGRNYWAGLCVCVHVLDLMETLGESDDIHRAECCDWAEEDKAWLGCVDALCTEEYWSVAWWRM